MPRLKQVMKVLEQLAPLHLAEKWDHVGLMVGDPEQEIHKVLCALDVNEAVVDEAIHLKADCIVSHHPFLFKPLTALDLSSEKGRMIRKLITSGIAVYSMHTNYDIAEGGLNDYLARGLGLQDIKVLKKTREACFYKVIIYVPETHVDVVREAIVASGAGQIGNYKGCTFTASGEGSFIPLEDSHPYIGEEGQLCKVNESAISFMVLKSELNDVIQTIKAVHPYEEMAYDVFEMAHLKKTYGLGRYGKCKEEITLGAFLEEIKTFFNIEHVRVSNDELSMPINSVALCSGEGSECMSEAARVAQVYITGDVKFHQAQMAQSLGMILIDVGHYASENRGLEPIGNCIKNAFKTCDVIYSKVNGETLFIK